MECVEDTRKIFDTVQDLTSIFLLHKENTGILFKQHAAIVCNTVKMYFSSKLNPKTQLKIG